MTRGPRAVTEEFGGRRQPDVWAMLIISFIVGTLGVFNVVNQTVIASATLAALGLVPISTIWGRIQIASLSASTGELVELTRLRADGAVSARAGAVQFHFGC